MFYIENNVLVYVLFDVVLMIMNDQKFLDINHMNMILIQMNVYVVHELLNHVVLKNIFDNHYIYMLENFLLRHIQHHHRHLHHHLQVFQIYYHLFLMMINLILLEKINLYNIENQEDILNVQLEKIFKSKFLDLFKFCFLSYLIYLH